MAIAYALRLSTGWLDIATVSKTPRAAKVNAICTMTSGHLLVCATATDAQIDEAFNMYMPQGASITQVRVEECA
jgi:hypothetical protein